MLRCILVKHYSIHPNFEQSPTVTSDEFAKNLREFCPELFEGEEEGNLDNDLLKNEEIYRKAKEDGKLEIAPKLLQKGFSREEVATILEIDVN
jgi:hypothetical protein